MGRCALRSNIVGDSSTIDVKSFAAVSGDDVNDVITDGGSTNEQRSGLEVSGHSMLIAPKPELAEAMDVPKSR